MDALQPEECLTQSGLDSFWGKVQGLLGTLLTSVTLVQVADPPS